jgi:hypothetical protein
LPFVRRVARRLRFASRAISCAVFRRGVRGPDRGRRRGGGLLAFVHDRLVERSARLGARRRRRVEAQVSLDGVQPLRVRLQHALKVFEALGEQCVCVSGSVVFGHKLSSRRTRTGGGGCRRALS